MQQSQFRPGLAIYLRVSSDDKQDPENSFAGQMQRIRDWLQVSSNSLPIIGEYTDVLSGLKAERTQYQKMLADARAKRFSHLVVYNVDRLGRSPEEILTSVKELLDLGLEIVVSDSPDLDLRSPTGSLLLGVRAVIAKYEVDMFSQRVRDTKHSILLAGGWPAALPDGYLRHWEQVGTRKRRGAVIELDPERSSIWREAWDLLLSGDYSMERICQELHDRGYVRKSGKPWAWMDDKRNEKRYAVSQIYHSFHLAFYAGWVVSKTFGIQRGEVRGRWDPLITDEEFDRGIAILRARDENKIRRTRHAYMLTGLLNMRIDNGRRARDYRMHGSTPKGRSKHYTYYTTTSKVEERRRLVSMEMVDSQVLDLLSHICVDSRTIPEMRKIYKNDLAKIKGPTLKEQEAELNERVKRLHTEEAAMARLFAQGRLTDVSYDTLHREWQEKVYEAQQKLTQIRQGTDEIMDGLEVALLLMTRLSTLFLRLDTRKQNHVLQILFAHIIIDTQGKVIDFELNPPFLYLTSLKQTASSRGPNGRGELFRIEAGSRQIQSALYARMNPVRADSGGVLYVFP